MANFYGFYPPAGGGSGSNASVGTNGATAPTSSTEVGGIDNSGNLHPLQTDSSGNLLVSLAAEPGAPLHVIVDSSALPTGASTSALQTSGNTLLTTIASNQTNGTQVTAVNNFPATQPVSGTVTANQGTPGVGAWPTLAAQSGTWNINNVSGTVSLPTGASTSALQTTGNTSLSSIDGKLGSLGQKAMAGSAPVVIASDQASFPVTIAAGSAVIGHVITDTGSTTAVTQATAASLNATVVQGTAANLKASVNLNDGSGSAVNKGQSTASGSLPVVLASDQSVISSSQKGRALANAPTVTTYGTPVTSAAYVQIIASTTSATNLVEIFDSSGVAIYFAVGAAASEVNQFVIYPGGNGQVPLAIPAGSRISYKAVSTSATGATAYNVLNLYT